MKQSLNAPLDDTKIIQQLGTIFHCTSHFSIDFFLSFFAPTLPVLIVSLDLLKVEVGLLVMALEITALTMPFIGRIADRKDIRKYMFLAPAVTALCMSSLSIIPNYALLLLVLLIGGLSIYFYHAIGPADMGAISEITMGRVMAKWNIAGQVGFMVGPLLISWILSGGTSIKPPYLAVIGILISIFLYIVWQRFTSLQQGKSLGFAEHIVADTKPINREILLQLLPVLGIIITSALARANAYAYFPVYIIEQGAALWMSGLVVSLYFGAGVIGQYIGGILYDKVGAKWVIAISIAGFAASFAAATFAEADFQLVLISLSGVFAFMLMPTVMAMLQENYPEDRSLTNGLFLGFMYSITALASVMSGYFLDRTATPTIFLISAAVSLLGLAFIPFLAVDKQIAK